MDKKGAPGYAGKIKNAGTQIVQAPNQTVDSKNSKVVTGTDLRSGK